MVLDQERAKLTGWRHSPSTAKGLETLKKPENRLKIVDLAVPYKDRVISLIGITDCDPERNLGDYQNMGYALLTESHEQRAVVIDPGLRESGWIRDALDIRECDVIFTHFHLDHWIGYEAFSGEHFFASPLCKTVLTQMVGAERTGKSIFVEGRLNDYHRRPLPLRAVNDAERLLPLRENINTVTEMNPYYNPDFGLEFFELPYGQTEGTLYGLLKTNGVKILFASDLFVMINNRIMVEPHYAFKPAVMVLNDIIIMLRALLGEKIEVQVDEITKRYMERIASPDILAMGHGIFEFSKYRSEITHLLRELEEVIRIHSEHII
jgi:glyoxylase-like metal-dependent hydrolase (beta-lactamase superfamily II)